jgi:hypothetical protein
MVQLSGCAFQRGMMRGTVAIAVGLVACDLKLVDERFPLVCEAVPVVKIYAAGVRRVVPKAKCCVRRELGRAGRAASRAERVVCTIASAISSRPQLIGSGRLVSTGSTGVILKYNSLADCTLGRVFGVL